MDSPFFQERQDYNAKLGLQRLPSHFYTLSICPSPLPFICLLLDICVSKSKATGTVLGWDSWSWDDLVLLSQGSYYLYLANPFLFTSSNWSPSNFPLLLICFQKVKKRNCATVCYPCVNCVKLHRRAHLCFLLKDISNGPTKHFRFLPFLALTLTMLSFLFLHYPHRCVPSTQHSALFSHLIFL